MKRYTKSISIEKLKYYLLILGMVNVLAVNYFLGTFGVGYFMLTFLFIVSLLTLVSLWSSDFIAKYVKGRTARKQYMNARHFLKGALLSVALPSFILSLLVFILGDILGNFLWKDHYIGVCIMVAAPIIFLWSLSEIISGYFRGMGMGNIAKIFLVIRQIGIAFFSIAGMKKCLNYGEKIAALLHNQGISAVYGAIGAILGVVLGCVLGLIVLLIFGMLFHGEFSRLYHEDTTKYPETVLDCSKIIFVSGFFSGLKSFFLFGSFLLDFVLMIRLCMKNVSSPEYMKIAGNFFGIILPVMAVMMCVFLLWNHKNFKGMSGFFRNEDFMQIRVRRIGTLLNTFAYILPISLAIAVLAEPLCVLLKCDSGDQISQLFMCSALLIFAYSFSGLEQRIFSVVNESFLPFLIIAGSFVGQTILALTFMKMNHGLLSIVIPLVVQQLCIALLLFISSIRKIRLSSGFLKKIVMILIISFASALSMLLIYQIVGSKLAPMIAFIVCFIPGIIIFFAAMTALRLITSSEAEHMPGGLIYLMINSFLHQE